MGSKAAAGFVIRVSNDSPIVVGSLNLGESTNFVVEALALRDALRFANVKGFKNVCVE